MNMLIILNSPITVNVFEIFNGPFIHVPVCQPDHTFHQANTQNRHRIINNKFSITIAFLVNCINCVSLLFRRSIFSLSVCQVKKYVIGHLATFWQSVLLIYYFIVVPLEY